MVEVHGTYPLPDEVVTGVTPPAVQPVYAVRFEASDLWGHGDHSVTVNLWEAYLEQSDHKEPVRGAPAGAA